VDHVDRIVLVGFSGTGKSTVARLLAERLGWHAADTDLEIERQWGVTIPEIFRDHGEDAFRASERAILARFLDQNQMVIATGGGAVVDPAVWEPELLGSSGTLVVALDAPPETILGRLQEQAAREGDAVQRPLLAGRDPLWRIRDLKVSRQPAYDAAHLTLMTEGFSAQGLADEVAAVAEANGGGLLGVELQAPSGHSAIKVAPALLKQLGEHVRERWPKVQRAWIVTDDNVGRLHATAAENSLHGAGVKTEIIAVAPGESSKSLQTAGELYDWLLRGGVERGDIVVALGGGVVGDLAGFVAATVLRGIGLVQVPTSLLAAVDSSVGGKTGINHAAGKNLIGAFLQPQLVLVDTDLLRTMPPRELRSGWAEVVKHAVIQRSTPGGERGDLATVLERNRERLCRLEAPATPYLVWRNISLKAAVVGEDEREAGIRAYLNFGHTIGHAIEAADYQLLHGEAVALGMRAAAELGAATATCCRLEVDRIEGLLGQFDLPVSAPLDVDVVLARMTSDKKRVAGRQRFVLPLDGGGVVMREDVPQRAVVHAISSVNSTGRPA
jgi:shikimate kinase/3-dehydroquinate synthase